MLLDREDVDPRALYRGLAEFFAKTIDDHFCEYTPWGLDPKRVPLFGRFFDDMGKLCVADREVSNMSCIIFYSLDSCLEPISVILASSQVRLQIHLGFADQQRSYWCAPFSTTTAFDR